MPDLVNLNSPRIDAGSLLTGADFGLVEESIPPPRYEKHPYIARGLDQQGRDPKHAAVPDEAPTVNGDPDDSEDERPGGFGGSIAVWFFAAVLAAMLAVHLWLRWSQ